MPFSRSQEVLTGPNSAIWISCCNDDNRIFIARLSGVVIGEGRLTCYLPEKFAQTMGNTLTGGRLAAVMSACTRTFDSYQVKGKINNVREASSAEITEQLQNLRMFGDGMTFRFLDADNIYNAYKDDTFKVIEITMENVYDQTPKEGTGELTTD